jgi:hypothetical protein
LDQTKTAYQRSDNLYSPLFRNMNYDGRQELNPFEKRKTKIKGTQLQIGDFSFF